jgi:ATP/maltotriose-dependent transcriptional regulator MalT
MESGDFTPARDLIRSVADAGADAIGRCAAARSQLVGLLVDLNAGDDEGWLQRARADVDRLIPVFTAADNDVGLATAWRVVANADVMALQFDEGFDAAARIVDHAEAAQDVRQQRRGAVVLTISTVQGSTPVGEGIERCEELITSLDGDRRTQALVQLGLAQLHAMRGDFAVARELCTSARTIFDELGWKILAASTSTDAAPVEILAGDLAAAEALLRRDLDDLAVLGETYLRSTVAGMLSHVLVELGRTAEAERVALEVRELAGPDDVDAQVLWRSSLGQCLAARGRQEEASVLLDEALELMAGTAAPMMRAQALTARAAVARMAEREDDARRDLDEAVAIYEAKGNVVGVAALRELLWSA